MTVKSSISLSDDQHAFARSLVRDGRFSSVSAVLQQGLDLLRQRAEAEMLELAALRSLLEERRAGPFIGGPALRSRVRAMIEAKRGDNDLAD